LKVNPVWVITIIFALLARKRNKFILERDVADSLFSLTAWILLVFPYLRALVLGVSDTFGEYTRLVHFLSPIYTLAGILSIRTIVRCELFRTFSPKQMVVGTATALIVLGATYILLLSPDGISPITPAIDGVLLVFFTLVLLWAGMRHANIFLFKREQPTFVTEEERTNVEFRLHDDVHDPKLSAPMIAVLHAVLLVLLAWNLATLPHAANDFADAVQHINHERAGEIGEYSSISLPQFLTLNSQLKTCPRPDSNRHGLTAKGF
jgi:hypothetical protein